MATVRFGGEDCIVERAEYGNGRIALRLVTQDGEAMAVCTANIPELPLAEGQAFIKDYTENEGMLDALVEAGVVADTGLHSENDYGVRFPIVRVLFPEKKVG